MTVLLAGVAPSVPLDLRTTLASAGTGVPALVVDGLLLVGGLSYLAAVRSLRRRRHGRRWPAARTAWWLVGLVMVYVAVGSGLAGLADRDPSANVYQHLLLMMFAPPLLVLGRPMTVLAQAAPRRVQVATVRLLGSRAVRALLRPVAWPLYYGTMAVYFLTSVYARSVGTAAFHDATLTWFFVLGGLFWAGLVGADLPGHRRRPGWRLVTLLVGMPIESAVSVALLFWPRPLAAGETVAAAHAAGLLLWIGSGVSSGLGVVIVVRQWFVADSRRAAPIELASELGSGYRIGRYEVRADGSSVPRPPVRAPRRAGRRRPAVTGGGAPASSGGTG